MNGVNQDFHTYLLIDNGLLQQIAAGYTEVKSKSRPTWLSPIYAERALDVSPFLVDIEAAYEAGGLDQVMCFWNACKPALHVSIIETHLDIQRITQHLRRFIFICNPDGKQFTLRYSDCTVLMLLSLLLTPTQWGAMRGPMRRWGVHDRVGMIKQLPKVQSNIRASTPFDLELTQLAALNEASEPDHVIAKVKMMRHGAKLPGNAEEQYTWAQAARKRWQQEKISDPLILIYLTEATILSRGTVLAKSEVSGFLAMGQVCTIREKLIRLTD